MGVSVELCTDGVWRILREVEDLKRTQDCAGRFCSQRPLHTTGLLLNAEVCGQVCQTVNRAPDLIRGPRLRGKRPTQMAGARLSSDKPVNAAFFADLLAAAPVDPLL